MNAILSKQIYSSGQHQLIHFVEDFIYPLKIVFTVEHDTLTVITVYPLKKGQ